MNLPPNKTEAEVLDAIEKAVNILSPSFVFGYFDLDDIKQQARLFGLQALARYDSERPLENFLYVHIQNRLINLVRDKLRRNDPPCAACHAGNPCGKYGEPCRKYREWSARNNAKANLMRPLDLQRVSDEREARTRCESSVSQDAEMAEIVDKIDRELPVELRASYLQMREGMSVPKGRRAQVVAAVKKILQGVVECPTNEDD